jgi:hypothetical protein
VGYPNVPLGVTEWQRKIAQAINYQLNKLTFFQFATEGQPDDAQQILITRFPVTVPLVISQCSGWAEIAPTNSATFTLNIDGAAAGYIIFAAGSQEASVSITTANIPAEIPFEIVAPTPQDATLADVTLTLATKI